MLETETAQSHAADLEARIEAAHVAFTKKLSSEVAKASTFHSLGLGELHDAAAATELR